MICPSESSIKRVRVSHVIVECRVINHHPKKMPTSGSKVLRTFADKVEEGSKMAENLRTSFMEG